MITIQEITIFDAYDNPITNLVQWDKDVKIYIKEYDIDSPYSVHFFNANMEEAFVVNSTYSSGTLKVTIPNKLLTEPLAIVGYIMVTKDGSQKGLFRFRINVIKRPMPSDYIYVESEDYVSLAKILDECRENATSASKSADSASKSASAAANSASAAKDSENNARNSEIAAEKWADGSTSTELATASGVIICTKSGVDIVAKIRSKTDQDSAHYYSDLAKGFADDAATSAATAKTYAEKSAKSAEESANSAEESAGSAADAADSADKASKSADKSATSAADSANSAKSAAESARNLEEAKAEAEKWAFGSSSTELATANGVVICTNKGVDIVAKIRSKTDQDSAMYYSELSKSYAIGETGKRSGENTDNARYYYEMARLERQAVEELVRQLRQQFESLLQ